MAHIRPTPVADDDFWKEERPGRRGKAFRYGVPTAVAGVAAVTIGLVPALADTGNPHLPKISTQDLISKMAASNTEQLSGTVKVSADLGIPSMASGLAGQMGGHHQDGGASASPQSKLTELASGTHTLRVAADGPQKQRVSILENAAEYSMIHNGDNLWAYDSGSNSVYHAKAKDGARHPGRSGNTTRDLRGVTPQALARQALAAAHGNTTVTTDGTARVAGQDAYQLLIKPKQGDSTIGAVRIAVDAHNGVPLQFTLSPRGGGKPVVQAGFTSVDFGKPKASTFDFTPPKGAKVTQGSDARHAAGRNPLTGSGPAGLSRLAMSGKGWDTVARLDLPGLAGLAGSSGRSSDDSAAAGQLLGALGKRVKGDFGSGTVINTRLVNALITRDGKVFVGAVDKDGLVKAADAASHGAR